MQYGRSLREDGVCLGVTTHQIGKPVFSWLYCTSCELWLFGNQLDQEYCGLVLDMGEKSVIVVCESRTGWESVWLDIVLLDEGERRLGMEKEKSRLSSTLLVSASRAYLCVCCRAMFE